jgi:hypothetical protein
MWAMALQRLASSFMQGCRNKGTPELLKNSKFKCVIFKVDSLRPMIEPKIFIFWRSVISPITKVKPYFQTATQACHFMTYHATSWHGMACLFFSFFSWGCGCP